MARRRGSRDDAANGQDDADDSLIVDGTAGEGPAHGHNCTRLEMANDGAGNGAGLRDDEELRNVDEGRQHAGLAGSLEGEVLEGGGGFVLARQIMSHLLAGTLVHRGKTSAKGIA